MKYIRKFNESLEYDNIVNDIKEQSNTLLVYLLDKGFIINITEDSTFNEGNSQVDIRVRKHSSTRDYERFKWDDVKDEFIPFLISMDYKPKFASFKIDYRSYNCTAIALDIEDVLDDKINSRLEMHRNHMKLVDENNINEIFVRFDVSKKR